jgi:hypothetical protein
MIYCIIKGKKAFVQSTHANNSGIVTTFLYRGKGNVSADSFSINQFKTVEEFIKSRYSAKIINDLES